MSSSGRHGPANTRYKVELGVSAPCPKWQHVGGADMKHFNEGLGTIPSDLPLYLEARLTVQSKSRYKSE